ncbi:putative RNA recognition motif domain, nucleotide-binding alpha-beta plait domain superfamily [Helianthus annuus]|nr:putative RNA recognition motif domain, nucleotide-binding alpha-beta plait domain superfamily [Helianthus annuus]
MTRAGDRRGTNVYYQNRRDNQVYQKPVTSFFVSNLPGGVSKSILWKAFQPYRLVQDAYVAKKRDWRGNFFGFIQYEGVHDAKATLYEMNKVKIFEAQLNVCLAKYDKDNRKIEYGQVKENARAQGFAPKNRQAKVYAPVSNTKGVSYKDVLQGEGKKKVVVADDRVAIYPDHCMIRLVIVETKGVKEMGDVRKLLDSAGLSDSPVSYVGGLKLMVVLKDKRSALAFINQWEVMWKDIFTSVVLWQGQDMSYDRLVWLNVQGVPIHLRGSGIFDKIGGLFGKVVCGSEFSWDGVDNSSGTCWVLMELGGKIDEQVDIMWLEKQYKVWVSEGQNQLFQSIISSLEYFEIENPAASMGSATREEEDLEDGELPVESAGREQDGRDQNPVPGGGTVEYEKVVNMEGVHGDGQPSSHVHGEAARFQTPIDMFQTPVPSKDGSVFMDQGGTRLENLFETNIDLGQGPVFRSRKRTRQARSPENVCPFEEACLDQLNGVNRDNSCTLDLNVSTKDVQDNAEISNQG